MAQHIQKTTMDYFLSCFLPLRPLLQLSCLTVMRKPSLELKAPQPTTTMAHSMASYARLKTADSQLNRTLL